LFFVFQEKIEGGKKMSKEEEEEEEDDESLDESFSKTFATFLPHRALYLSSSRIASTRSLT
jgi:hypothetical protein